MGLTTELKGELEKMLGDNHVVLFMKGRRTLPQCGFSAKLVQILDQFLPDYHTVNVLESPEMRDGIKEFSDWPTIPQLYVKGKFVGGCDIVSGMYDSGELHQVLGVEVAEVEPPTITITDSAKKSIAEAMEDAPGTCLRFIVDPAFKPSLDFDKPNDMDIQVESNGIKIVLDRASAGRANGVKIDFVGGLQAGFKIDNPNEPPKVRQIEPKELKARMDAGEPFELFDVRTEEERKQALIEGAKLLDDAASEYLMNLDRDDTLVVFHCHTGRRSQSAAQHFLQQGFKKVYNMSGGIDAWSLQVDSKVPRY